MCRGLDQDHRHLADALWLTNHTRDVDPFLGQRPSNLLAAGIAADFADERRLHAPSRKRNDRCGCRAAALRRELIQFFRKIRVDESVHDADAVERTMTNTQYAHHNLQPNGYRNLGGKGKRSNTPTHINLHQRSIRLSAGTDFHQSVQLLPPPRQVRFCGAQRTVRRRPGRVVPLPADRSLERRTATCPNPRSFCSAELALPLRVRRWPAEDEALERLTQFAKLETRCLGDESGGAGPRGSPEQRGSTVVAHTRL